MAIFVSLSLDSGSGRSRTWSYFRKRTQFFSNHKGVSQQDDVLSARNVASESRTNFMEFITSRSTNPRPIRTEIPLLNLFLFFLVIILVMNIRSPCSTFQFQPFRVGGPHRIFWRSETKEQLDEALQFARKNIFLFPGRRKQCSFSDFGFQGLVLCLRNREIVELSPEFSRLVLECQMLSSFRMQKT